MILFAETDLAGWAAMIAAMTPILTVLFGLIWRLWIGQRKLQFEYNRAWKGIVARGFLEALDSSHMYQDGVGGFIISDVAKALFGDKIFEFRKLRKDLSIELGHEPSIEALGWAIEQKYQTWLVEVVCPTLKVRQYGCIAIACVLARETNGRHNAIA